MTIVINEIEIKKMEEKDLIIDFSKFMIYKKISYVHYKCHRLKIHLKK